MKRDTVSRFCLDAFLAYARDAIADDRVWIEAIPRMGSKGVGIRVNWYSSGAVTPAEAEVIADCILTASALARLCSADGAEICDATPASQAGVMPF